MEIKAYAIQGRGEAETPFVYHRTLGPHDVLVRITHRSITRGDVQFIDAFDFILSTLNVPFDLDPYLKMLRPEGQFCFVATPLEPLSLRAGALYDYARRSIYGSYVGSRSDTLRMLAFAAEHGVLSNVEVVPFSDPNEAIGRVRSREMATALVLESLGSR
jgi:D-arabinose 1-dehydrogenase-like Zn-dependent alcohol dehydrogenase